MNNGFKSKKIKKQSGAIWKKGNGQFTMYKIYKKI